MYTNIWSEIWKEEEMKNVNLTHTDKLFVLRLRKYYTTKSMRIELNQMQYDFDSSLDRLVYKIVTFIFVLMTFVVAIYWILWFIWSLKRRFMVLKSIGICQTYQFKNEKSNKKSKSKMFFKKKSYRIYPFIFFIWLKKWNWMHHNRFKFELHGRQLWNIQLIGIFFFWKIIFISSENA